MHPCLHVKGVEICNVHGCGDFLKLEGGNLIMFSKTKLKNKNEREKLAQLLKQEQ